jgi:hypothetical protein
MRMAAVAVAGSHELVGRAVSFEVPEGGRADPIL